MGVAKGIKAFFDQMLIAFGQKNVQISIRHIRSHFGFFQTESGAVFIKIRLLPLPVR